MTSEERLFLIGEMCIRVGELFKAEAAERSAPTAAPRKARRVAPPEPATARGIAIARQAVDMHRRSKGT